MTAERWVLVDEGTLAMGARIVLDQLESRHLATALRLRPGDRVTLCDGQGGIAEAVLAVVDAKRCQAEVIALPQPTGDRPTRVAVGLGVLHSQAMDWAVQKCVETGVSTFVPLLVERSQLGPRAAQGRDEHWRRVARQALKQCRRPWQMEVARARPLEQLVAERGAAAGLVADQAGRRLAELRGPLPGLLAVGPEGGFSPREQGLLAQAGWPGVRLGRWVLRAETAAVVGAAMLIEAHEGRAGAGNAPGPDSGPEAGTGTGTGTGAGGDPNL